MNKQCQQPQAHPDRCGCVREIAEHNARAYAESIAALAAKDARIAELEGVLAKALAFTEVNTFGGTDALALIEECHAALASKQQSEPTMAKNVNVATTHSGDGREAPEVVAELILGGIDGNEAGDNDIVVHSKIVEGLQDRMVTDSDDVLAPLMTVAQHERIVAALDAEIARVTVERNRLIGNARSVFKDMAEMALKQRDELAKELAALRAQPARQVGDVQLTGEYHADVNMLLERIPRQVGDEPIRDDDLVLVPRGLLGAARYAIKNKVDAPNLYGQLGEYCYGQAARAPAAVVMPDQYSSADMYDDRYGQYMQGWNAAICEVARLNRRTIPAGLLDRVCAWPETFDDRDRRDVAIDELRALLGKDGSQ